MFRVAVINGANLNLLGAREPVHYGLKTLEDIARDLEREFKEKITFNFFQSNSEGALIDHVQGLKNIDGIVINPGAFTHTSIALRDALLARSLPTIEVHLSNVHAREPFRKHSYFSDICRGTISGLGPQVYRLAIFGLLSILAE
ncbi:MAG TPA: type II 3-dehydroquinate dehydratase [Myxococcota bacterium]|nr:type II 3-dehydroquinate dehydratase [Myxococcota bacterium]